MLTRRRSFAVLAVLVAAGEVAVDSATPILLNVAVLYGLPLVLAGFSRNRRLLWTLTVLLLCATFTVYALQIPEGAFSLSEGHFVNRMLAATALVLTAVLLHVLVRAMNALEARAQEDRDASERKTRLLASASHDIHTPLTSINLMADMIRSLAGKPGAEITELAINLQASAAGLTSLVADILDASHFTSGKVELHESDFSLGELIVDEKAGFAAVAEAKGLRLQVNPAVPLVWLHADKVKLARVLRNLISNAIKFTSSGGIELNWSLSPESDAVIRVSDTGRGIGANDVKKVFDEFARFDTSIRDQAGWGLGLPICRRLVGLMGGSIGVESRLNEGSTFTVRLPSSRVIAGPSASTS